MPSEPHQPDGTAPQDGHQLIIPELQAIFAAQADPGDNPLYERLLPTARWTRDPVFLIDVPIAVDEDVRDITIEILNEHGERTLEKRKGKIVTRRAPHPDLVRLGKEIIPREVAESRGIINTTAPVMVDLTTVVKYDNGVVQQVHLDVLHAILHLLSERFLRTGTDAPRITTTYWDIAEVLGRPLNGRLARSINEAGETLSGLHVSKYYGWTGQEQVQPATAEIWGSIITYFKANAGRAERRTRGPRGSSRGPTRETVVFEVNPSLMSAICGRGTDRVYVTRPLNLTKNLGYRIRWKKHFHRIIESRFDATGSFNMPLGELWVSCFGNPPSDITQTRRLYYVRSDVREFLDALVGTGYLSTGDIVNAREEAVRLPDQLQIDPKSLKIQLDDAAATAACHDWVRATPGPTYWSQRPPRRQEFARDILRNVLNEAQITRLLSKTDHGLVIDVGYHRLKTVLSAYGESVGRLPIELWYNDLYPQEPFDLTVRRMVITQARPQADIHDGIAAQRLLFCRRWIQRRMGLPPAGQIADAYLARFANPEGATAYPEPGRATRERIDEAITAASRILTKTLNLDVRLGTPEVWAGPDAPAHVSVDRLMAQWRTYGTFLAEAATAAVALNAWYAHLDGYIAGKLPPGEIPARLWNTVRGKQPDVGDIVVEMLAPGRPDWETALGLRLQRRAVELHLEAERIQELVPGVAR